MDPIDVFARTLSATGDVVHGIKPEQLDAATPCAEWTVRDVLNHIVGVVRRYAQAAAGEPLDDFNPLAKAPDVIGDDPAAAYDDAAQRCASAWRERGNIDGEIQLWGPKPSPAPFVWQIGVCDTLIHGWDLARATGQTYPIDDEIPAEMLGRLRQTLTDDFRGTAFKPAVEVPDDAPVIEQLAAFSGRTP